MAVFQQDAFERIQASLDAWADDVCACHKETAQLVEQIEAGVQLLAARDVDEEEVELLRDELGRLERELAERDRTIGELETLLASQEAPTAGEQEPKEPPAEPLFLPPELPPAPMTTAVVDFAETPEPEPEPGPVEEAIGPEPGPDTTPEPVPDLAPEPDTTPEPVPDLAPEPDTTPEPEPAREEPTLQRFETPESIPAFDARGHKRRMGDILLDMGLVTRDQLKGLLKAQSGEPQRRLGALAVDRGYTSDELVARILAAQLRLPFVRIDDVGVDVKALQRVPPQMARAKKCVPLSLDGEHLRVAMANPLDLIAVEDIEISTGLRVEPAVAVPADIERAIAGFYGGR